jgi:hypothetical protein
MLDALRAAGPPDDALRQVREAAGALFVRGLEHCGVFGADTVAGCRRFLDAVT